MANLLPEGTYEKLEIIGTRLESHKPGQPKIIVTLAEPGAAGDGEGVTDFPKISDYLYTSDEAWDKVTMKRLAAYGWDAKANGFDLTYFNDPANALIGTTVGPVVLKDEPYVKDGQTKSSMKVYRVGNEKFGSQMGGDEAKAETNLFQQRMRLRYAGAGADAFANSLPSYGAPTGAPAAKAPTDEVPF